VASKEWVIRQYDHEVQGGSVVKPLVGVENDGPSDAAIVRPVLDSRRGVVVSCGMNPRYGDFDTYHMATSAIDEAMRNCVAVGADPARIAILDNFCWGDCDRPETLGSLVRAAIACHDMAVALGTPFISGKDSLNNEFSYVDSTGAKHSIAIPPSLLISAMGQITDVAAAVTMDLKSAGNLLYQIGVTRGEMGGSHYGLCCGHEGGFVPEVDPVAARRTFAALHQAINARLVRACHDLSEGGLAACLAEMSFAGGLGVEASLANVPHALTDDEQQSPDATPILLFSESNTRFVVEIAEEKTAEFEKKLAGVPFARIGRVTQEQRVRIAGAGERADQNVVDADLATLKEAWQAPLRW
jgi:phosphoribosylformylglycinamidine synthase